MIQAIRGCRLLEGYDRQLREYQGARYLTSFRKLRFGTGRGRGPGRVFTPEQLAELEQFLLDGGHCDFTTLRVWLKAQKTPKSGEVVWIDEKVQIRVGEDIVFSAAAERLDITTTPSVYEETMSSTNTTLANKTIPELRLLATEEGINGADNMNKAQLYTAISAARAARMLDEAELANPDERADLDQADEVPAISLQGRRNDPVDYGTEEITLDFGEPVTETVIDGPGEIDIGTAVGEADPSAETTEVTEVTEKPVGLIASQPEPEPEVDRQAERERRRQEQKDTIDRMFDEAINVRLAPHSIRAAMHVTVKRLVSKIIYTLRPSVARGISRNFKIDKMDERDWKTIERVSSLQTELVTRLDNYVEDPVMVAHATLPFEYDLVDRIANTRLVKVLGGITAKVYTNRNTGEVEVRFRGTKRYYRLTPKGTPEQHEVRLPIVVITNRHEHKGQFVNAVIIDKHALTDVPPIRGALMKLASGQPAELELSSVMDSVEEYFYEYIQDIAPDANLVEPKCVRIRRNNIKGIRKVVGPDGVQEIDIKTGSVKVQSANDLQDVLAGVPATRWPIETARVRYSSGGHMRFNFREDLDAWALFTDRLRDPSDIKDVIVGWRGTLISCTVLNDGKEAALQSIPSEKLPKRRIISVVAL